MALRFANLKDQIQNKLGLKLKLHKWLTAEEALKDQIQNKLGLKQEFVTPKRADELP